MRKRLADKEYSAFLFQRNKNAPLLMFWRYLWEKNFEHAHMEYSLKEKKEFPQKAVQVDAKKTNETVILLLNHFPLSLDFSFKFSIYGAYWGSFF